MEVGSIVQVESGGPLMTVTHCNAINMITRCTYFNQVTGLFEQNVEFPTVILKSQFSTPEVPGNVSGLRNSSVTARSSLVD